VKWLAVVVLAGCAGDFGASGDDTPGPDANPGCDVFLSFNTTEAIAGPTTEIRATANVTGAPGVLDYSWQVTKGTDVPFTYQQLDHSAIAFTASDTGAYHVQVAVSGGNFCPTAQGNVNVGIEGAGMTQVRVRVYPAPGTMAPPQEQMKLIPGGPGEYALNQVAIDPGVVAMGLVRDGATPIPAYLRFIPLGGRDAYVEAYASTDGAFATRTLNQVHDVLVVPTIAGYAPKLVTSWTPGMNLAISPGVAITGTVVDPAGAPVANAQVQIQVDGTPSTLATTNGAGAFTVRAEVPIGANELRVDVAPPVASGLPRVSGASMTLTPTMPIAVAYASALVRRDVGGTVVRRGGVAQANIPVKLVGTIGTVATITTGSTTITANGEVRIATQTTGTGALPAGTLAPNAPLSAVSQISGQLAVGTFDLTLAVPAAIDAPGTLPITTVVNDAAGSPLPNALVELVPAGALRLAGASTLRASTNASGVASLAVPAGGVFDLRASDPQGKGAPVRFEGVPAASIAPVYALAKSKQVTGTLLLSGNPQPVGRATIQILCTLCAGVERTRPMAEGSSSSGGDFSIAVLDAGMMMSWQ
jgi:hypothetical protein